MADYSNVEPLFQRYLEQWAAHPISKRITDVESSAISSGRVEPWDGPTIVDFWVSVLQEYTQTLRQNPDLLKDPTEEEAKFKKALQSFLDEQQTLLDEADTLRNQIDGYVLKALDPRWWRDKNKLSDVVNKFALVDSAYRLNLDNLPKYGNQTNQT